MIIEKFVTGFLDVNNYLLIDENSKEAVLIDCTEKNDDLDAAIKIHGAKLKYILLTHGHFDHVLGVNETKKKYNCKALIHKEDEILLKNIDKFMSGFGFAPSEIQKVDGNVEDGETITFGDKKIKVIHTPGHSKGSVCYLIDNCLYSGDTIFREAVGRTDLFGGSFSELKSNIENKIFTLDENIQIYPGHGSSSTVGYEKVNNKFL